MEKFKNLFLLFFLMSITSGYSLTNYCATARSSASPNTSYTLNYTCRNVSGTTYEFKLEFPSAVTNITNANIGANPGPINIGSNLVFSNSNKTISYQFTAGSTPSLYVATIFVIIGGTEVRWDLPTDANFAATCSSGGNPAPTFGAFTIPAKVTGDADFAITAPTSNSTGAFSYTSSNTGVATISGSTIHIVGGGSSTITATQAADASHSTGSTTTVFNVTLAITTPTAGPATPPARNPWDVFSQYGAAYTNQPGVAFFDFGGSTIVGDVTLADNSVVKKYTNHLYSGIGANGALSLNVSAMTKMHIDVWSPDFVSFKIKLEAANGVARELEVPTAKVQGAWNSYDLDLSTYTSAGGPDLSQLRYIVPVTTDGSGRTLYITNVYFYRPATSLPPPTLGAFTVPAKNVGDADFALTAPTSNSTGAWTYVSGNTSVATITGSTVHIVGGGTSTITANQAADASHSAGTTSASFVVNFPNPPAAPTQPARNPSDVLSLFAGAYSNVSGTDFNPNWGQAANYPNNFTTPSYGGDPVKRYENSGTYQGTAFSNIDVSVINKLHVDIYSYTMTSLRISLINAGGPEAAYPLSLTPNSWNSFDIDVNATNFPGVNLTAVNQIKYDLFRISGVDTGNQVLIVDNLYFYREVLSPPTFGTFTVPAKLLGDADFAITPPTSNSAGTISYTSSNTAVATIVGGTNIHIVGAGTSTITANQTATSSYAAGSTTASLVVTVPPLTVAAPTPPARNSFDVISLYSNAYATSSSPTWQNAAATTDEQLQGNDTKKMSNFLVEFINFTPTNLTAMTTLHMDLYSEDCTGMNIWLLNNGDRNAQITLIPNQWNSIDIPMSTYVNLGLNLNGVSLLKFESLNGGGKTVYVDNVYFYRPATLAPPTLANFTVPAKTVGDADFTLTAPTSDSNGAFSYTSSNTAVATISGSTVHIVGGGTSTITATQAATGSFGSASITAQLVVAFAPPTASPVPPARTPDRVVSMYTGTPSVYANAITTVRSTWTGATTLTEVPNGTNTALRIDNFGFIGLVDQAETRFNVTGMSHLNIDIYLNEALSSNPALNRVMIYLLANGDYLYNATNLNVGWNTIRIPLTEFPGADLTNIYGIKLENPNAATQIYVDNLYFSNDCYTYYADADHDGYGNPSVSLVDCSGTVPAGYVLNNTDCNDAVASIHPGAVEIAYDGVDNNCDGTIDEGFPQITTSLLASDCNSTLASVGSLIGITTLAPGSAYTGWRVRLTNGSQVQVMDFNVPHFTLTQFPVYDYATTYTVDIQLQRNGVWLGYYGPTCQISSPAILAQGGAASVSPTQCGMTLPKINTLIATTSLLGATGYRFRVTNLTLTTGPNVVQTIDRSLNWFSLQMLAQYNYGSTYRIEIAVKTGTGQFGGFGSPCEITSPAAPSLINCGGTVATKSANVAAISVAGVTQYRFQVTRESDGAVTTIDRSTNYFTFNMIPVSAYTAGALYDVRVAVMTTGTWSSFGDLCTITSPGAAAKGIPAESNDSAIAVSEFKATAYPNPFASEFAIEAPASDANVEVKVYDMVGRLIETKSVKASDLGTQRLGTQYPSGVYNVIVSQGDVVKTLRVIKR